METIFNVIISYTGQAEYEIRAESKDEAITKAEREFEDAELWLYGDTVREPSIELGETVAIERRAK